ncbi:MAG: segregation/condensation protein A [Oscillospiraceae bacterium]|jgi:segregation and condensation protein A|nr:segregation/condensation protein A [Oscillospiraceae bacterium]
METPVFKLEGIVKEKHDMTDFEGPLALILQLLSKDKIEIRDISISSILDQYLAFLDEMTEQDLDVASEFVAMASHLTYIKTKMLLSGDEEISELEQLITSLEQLQRGDTYLQIRKIAETLSCMYSRDALMMSGPPEYYTPDAEYKYVHISEELLEAIYRVVGKENLKLSSINQREPTYPGRQVYPISEKINEVIDKLKRGGETKIQKLFYGCKSRTELIATLVAVLELCRVGSVLLTGENEDIMISYSNTGRETEIVDFTLDE